MFFDRLFTLLPGRSTKKSSSCVPYICRLFVGVAVVFGTLSVCQDAHAQWGLVSSWSKDNGDVVIIAQDESDGSLWWFEFDEDDNVIAAQHLGDDNPNPDDGTTSPGDKDTWAALLKQHGGGISDPNVEKTPIGRYLAGKNKGINPVHNPSEDPDGGPSPSGSTGFKDPKDDFYETGGEGHLGDAGGIDGNGGSIGSQLEDLGRRKGTNKNDDGSNDAKPEDGGLWGPEMPGPPELVNPNPTRGANKSFVLVPTSIMGTSSSGRATAATTTGSLVGNSSALRNLHTTGPGMTASPVHQAASIGPAGSMGLRPIGPTISIAPTTNLMRAIR